MPRPSKWSFSFSFPQQNRQCYSLLPHTCHTLRTSWPPPFDHPDNIWWAAQIMKLFVLLCSPFPVPTPVTSSLSVPCSRTASVYVLPSCHLSSDRISDVICSSKFRLHLRLADWQYNSSAAGAQRALSHVRHAIPGVTRLELLRAKPDNIFCSASIQRIPASTLSVVSPVLRQTFYI